MQLTIETSDASSRLSEGSMRRLALAAAVLFLAGILALAVTPATSAESDLPKVVGSLERYPAEVAAAVGVANLKQSVQLGTENGVAIAYPKLSRLYQVYNMERGPHAGAMVVVERDMATLAMGRVLIIPNRSASMANGARGGEWISTFDHNHDRLYIAYTPPGGTIGAVTGPTQNLPGLIGIDLHQFTFKDSSFPNFLVSTADLALILAGLEYDESTDTLLVLQAGNRSDAALANALLLVEWKAKDLLQGGPLPQVTPRPVRACKRDPLNSSTTPYLTPILVASAPDLEGDGQVKTWVMFPCYSTNYSANVVVVRLDRSSATNPQSTQEKVVVAPAGVSNWAVDNQHGRMYLVNDSTESDAWVYEAASNAFVGIIALSPRGKLEAGGMSLGVDEASGRLYARAPSYGLMITAAAQDPVPQADAYPQLGAGSTFRLLVDGPRDRLFSLRGLAGSGSSKDAYDIIAVPPPRPAPKRDDPDSRTAQVDEAPNKTIAQYGGNASAYGLRVLLARGFSGAVPSNGNREVGNLYRDVNSYCGFTDRELVLARVAKTEFSNSSRFARAAAVDLDNATVVDMKAPSRCDVYNAYKGNTPSLQDIVGLFATTGVLGSLDRAGAPASKTLNDAAAPRTTWDYTAADCSMENGQDAAGPNSAPFVGDTSVDCGKDNEIAAKAESRLKPISALDISVNKAVTTTKVVRDKDKGLMSVATSRLEGVRIGEISIGYIENSATAFAKGRNGTAGTIFNAPKIGYVEGNGIPTCTDRCNVDQVLDALNNALSGRAEFRRIEPEARLAKGSPGGYEAGIIKSEKQQASDNSLSGDKSVELPAFELVVYNDNTQIGRARQVYQFAGVRADSHYGIQLIGEGTGGLADIGDVLDGVTGDLVESVGALPNGGEALAVRVPAVNENPVRRTIRQSAAGANYSLRVIFSNPREAMVMATVWLLMWGPFVASRRRRALKAVTTADPEGPFA